MPRRMNKRVSPFKTRVIFTFCNSVTFYWYCPFSFFFFYSCIAGSKKTKNDVERLKSPTQKLTFSPKEKSEEQSRKTATSLILFEEVDVIFEEDSGFLAAIKTFMTTTKRPVILTTSGEMTTKVKDDILLCQVFNLCVCVCKCSHDCFHSSSHHI